MSKSRVAVLRGGPSDEYEVSLKTGGAVLSAIDREHFEPIDIVITKSGEWLLDGRVKYPEHVIPAMDVVFIALHGAYGEDGTIQRILDRYGVPYTGSTAYASGIAMHKGLTKDHLRGTSIQVSPHYMVRRESDENVHTHAARIRELFGPEYIVKPASSGSSVGVEIVLDTQKLGDALNRVLENSREAIVEKYIRGREFTCGVVERFRDHELYALPVIEIIPPPTAEFFNYDVKYNGETKEMCPASLTISEKRMIESAAKKAHETLDLRQYSRSDFILGNDGLYFLEVNTLPGLTTESLLPKALNAVGSSHSEFVNHLITDALQHC